MNIYLIINILIAVFIYNLLKVLFKSTIYPLLGRMIFYKSKNEAEVIRISTRIKEEYKKYQGTGIDPSITAAKKIVAAYNKSITKSK